MQTTSSECMASVLETRQARNLENVLYFLLPRPSLKSVRVNIEEVAE